MVKHERNDMSQTAHHLFTATLKIAAANHYMVGYAADTTADISFDDFSDAHRLLVDCELADGKHTHRYDIAFAVLDALCFRLHRAHLGQ